MSTENDTLLRWNAFLHLFRQRIMEPSSARPAVRCWTRPALSSLIARISQTELSTLKSTFPSAKEVIRRLEEIGWVRWIQVEASQDKTSPEICMIDMEASSDEMPDPLELLQGYEPKGVLCYFGVIALHELTTQRPPFYHVARLQKLSTHSDSSIRETSSPSHSTRKERSLQGTHLFNFQDVACYSTKRSANLVPGVQTRIIGSRTWLRVTTIEQTLLDTLHHTIQCGGEDVAFEAWQRGAPRCNGDRMADYLSRLSLPELDRRVGAMLDILKVKIDSPALARCLASVQNLNIQPVPLLKKFPYTRLHSTWQVFVP